MNRTKKFALNSVFAALHQVVSMIAGFIIPGIIISTYGSEVNGLVSSLTQIISYITLVEAGIGGAAIFSLYKPLALNDRSAVSRIVVAAKKSYAQAGYIFSSAIFFLAIILAFLQSSETLSFTTILSLTLLFGINGCFDFFLLSGYRVLFVADQKNYIISFTAIVHKALQTVIICLLAYSKVNIVTLYLIAVIPIFLKAAIVLWYGKKKYPYLDKNSIPDKSSLNKRWDVIYQQVLGAVQSGAPTIIATVLFDLKIVSVYSVYNMVLSGLNAILNIFTTGLPAGFGELIAKKEISTLKKSVAEFESAFYFIITIVFGVTFALLLPFVSIYSSGFDDINYYYPVLAFIITLNGALYSVKTPQSMLVISAGMYKETRWHVTIQAVIIIVGGFVFGRIFGLVGLLVGACLSNLYRTINLLYFTNKYILFDKPWKSCGRICCALINMALIAVPAVLFDISPANYFEWALFGCAFVVYGVVVATISAMLFDRNSFLGISKRILAILKR